MKKKKIDWWLYGGFIFVVFALIVVCILILVNLEPQFTITKEGVEVNNLTACCVEIKGIDYFENYSSHYNVSRTTTTNYMDEEIFCFPEGKNILGFDCNIIKKEELGIGWFDKNAEECYFAERWFKPATEGIFESLECQKYKFGDYIINIEK